jgi:polysaccharide export outer membrane protein
MLVSVWKDEQLTREVVVRPDGMFSFPLVGDVQAEDRTVEEIRADLVKRLTKYIPNPNVSVAVTKVLSYKIYVVGRVNKPGEYLIGHYTDVLQALSLAGGLTPFAAENDIKVIRRVRGSRRFPFDTAMCVRGTIWSKIFSCSVATPSWCRNGCGINAIEA